MSVDTDLAEHKDRSAVYETVPGHHTVSRDLDSNRARQSNQEPSTR